MSKTQTEAEIEKKYGPIRFYELCVYKKITSRVCWMHSQTITCHTRDEMEDKLCELSVKAPTMNSFKTGRQRYPVSQVMIQAWTAVRGYSAFKRYGKFHKTLGDLKPIHVEIVDIVS